jgi:hypothetical protein
MHLLAIAYLVGLAAVLAVGVRSPHLRPSRAVIAIYLLFWAVLILTAQVLSLFSAINVTGAYVILSFVIATFSEGHDLYWLVSGNFRRAGVCS